jgi:hypothetical protein
MKQLYVGKLCALLHDLGTTQHALAEHLHVARATVAGWAAGQRPVPVRYALDLCQFAAGVIRRACDKAWADNRDLGPASVLSRSPAERFEDHLRTQLEAWAVERFHGSHRQQQVYEQHAAILRAYLHLPLNKLSRDEHQKMKAAAQGVLTMLRVRDHYHEDPTGPPLGGVPVQLAPRALSPLELFWEIAYWEAGSDHEDTHETHH